MDCYLYTFNKYSHLMRNEKSLIMFWTFGTTRTLIYNIVLQYRIYIILIKATGSEFRFYREESNKKLDS